eukprot:2893024-Pyramimonas_sp.AAC.1
MMAPGGPLEPLLGASWTLLGLFRGGLGPIPGLSWVIVWPFGCPESSLETKQRETRHPSFCLGV